MIVYVVSSLIEVKLVHGAFSTEKAARQYIADQYPEYTENVNIPGVFEADDSDNIHIVECELTPSLYDVLTEKDQIEEYVYEPGKLKIYKALVNGKCPISGITKEQLIQENPDYIFSNDWVFIQCLIHQAENDKFIKPWVEVTEEDWEIFTRRISDFDTQLDHRNNTESRRGLISRIGEIYTFGVRINTRYFAADRRPGMTHEEMVEEVVKQFDMEVKQ